MSLILLAAAGAGVAHALQLCREIYAIGGFRLFSAPGLEQRRSAAVQQHEIQTGRQKGVSMFLKKLTAAAAGAALLASTSAVAASNAAPLPVAAAAVAVQDDEDGYAPGTLESYIPIAVVVVFTAVFAFFLLDATEDDDDDDDGDNVSP